MGKRIDMTPTWTGMVPVMVALIESGNAAGRATAISELYRMAGALDALIAVAKPDTAQGGAIRYTAQAGEVL